MAIRANFTKVSAEAAVGAKINSWREKEPASVTQTVVNRIHAAPNPPLRKQIIDEKDFVEPKEVAKNIPITGPIAGRMVKVDNGDVDRAFRHLKNVVNANNIRFDKQQQRFYKKPGKALEEKRIRRKKRMFDEGIRRLMNIVKDAKRRGY
ncbi:hypothetical protein BON22_1607 [Cyberlindnera fabianii]|uniref:37S ribosomal protein MRP21, mitochondrial n=1 Tax=Cyberlindnera fabianii TaxID=36022 RepID=A0A1V2LAU3_CYBFA|nr:hypothetical protein BON22_1607 [Cyberlindnera fabianii]